MFDSGLKRRPLPSIALAATVGLICACAQHPPVVAATPPTPAPAAAAGPAGAARGRGARNSAAPVRNDSASRANAASFAELEREAARSDSLNRASAAVMTRQGDLRESLIAQVHFDLDESKLRDADARLMDRKAAIMTANRTVRLRLVGYADDRAAEDYDQTLGMHRADAARQYLVTHGVDSSRVAVSSNGNAHPICIDKNEKCSAENRRVEFYIVDAPNLLLPGTTVAR
jgi:outer membrane protein OmpA-like peptidoglycan-associated protein